MTREHANELAAELFDGHPAAAALLMESLHGTTVERRRRSWMAALALDPDRALPHRWPENEDRMAAWRGGPLEAPVLAVTDLIVLGFYGSRPDMRIQAGRFLAAICARAAELVKAAEKVA